jgi:hypothetical protein
MIIYTALFVIGCGVSTLTLSATAIMQEIRR